MNNRFLVSVEGEFVLPLKRAMEVEYEGRFRNATRYGSFLFDEQKGRIGAVINVMHFEYEVRFGEKPFVEWFEDSFGLSYTFIKNRIERRLGLGGASDLVLKALTEVVWNYLRSKKDSELAELEASYLKENN